MIHPFGILPRVRLIRSLAVDDRSPLLSSSSSAKCKSSKKASSASSREGKQWYKSRIKI
jgi:hypothetical protein